MSFHIMLQELRSTMATARGQRNHRRRGSLLAATHRPHLEVLEVRSLLSFSMPTSYPIDGSSPTVATADFNNDGKLDLVTANVYGNTVSVLLGDGAGGFGAASQFGVGAVARSLVAADFNNDGHLDLATLGRGVSVLLGNGDGTFQPPVQTAILPGANSVAAADFNADGNMDLVYSSDPVGWASVEVLLGDGHGGFAARDQYQIHTSSPERLAVADLNADSRPDVVTANQEGTVSVLLGNGDGTLGYNFDSSNFHIGRGYIIDLAVGDFTSDGIPDLGIAMFSGYGGVAVLPGRGDGTFAAPIGTSGPAGVSLAAADFNRDGTLDILTTWWDSDYGYAGNLFLGSGDGTFNVSEYVELGGEPYGLPDAVVAGDFNGDGGPDVAVAVNDYVVGNAVTVMLNNGDWAPLLPSLRINDRTVTEGNTGTASATFNVTLSAASGQSITVAYASGNGTATAGSDFNSTSGTLTFAPGETSKTITVLVNGDRLPEPNETFLVNLSSPTNATIANGQGTVTIVDDEPHISISDVTKAEGKKGQTTLFIFTVTLSAAYDQPVTMSFRTVDGTAKTSDNDYVAKADTVTFAAGETSKTITIVVQGDSKRESNETFYLDLFGNSSNSLFTKKRGLGTIRNDD
jgi:Calx-beta domain/FG-GAP-like repeat